MVENRVPTLAKILSVLGCIAGGLFIIFSVVLLVLGLSSYGDGSSIFNFVFFVLLSLFIGVYLIVISMNLWRGRDWARMLFVFLGYVLVFMGVLNLIFRKNLIFSSKVTYILMIIIGVPIILYLYLNNNVKRAFEGN